MKVTVDILHTLARVEGRRHPRLKQDIDDVVVFALENIRDGADAEAEIDEAIQEIEYLIEIGDPQ